MSRRVAPGALVFFWFIVFVSARVPAELAGAGLAGPEPEPSEPRFAPGSPFVLAPEATNSPAPRAAPLGFPGLRRQVDYAAGHVTCAMSSYSMGLTSPRVECNRSTL
jgi:hypothetical protein